MGTGHRGGECSIHKQDQMDHHRRDGAGDVGRKEDVGSATALEGIKAASATPLVVGCIAFPGCGPRLHASFQTGVYLMRRQTSLDGRPALH